jgi:hypothetical protein
MGIKRTKTRPYSTIETPTIRIIGPLEKKPLSIFKKLVHPETISTDLKLFAFPALCRIFSEILAALEHIMQLFFQQCTAWHGMQRHAMQNPFTQDSKQTEERKLLSSA